MYQNENKRKLVSSFSQLEPSLKKLKFDVSTLERDINNNRGGPRPAALEALLASEYRAEEEDDLEPLELQTRPFFTPLFPHSYSVREEFSRPEFFSLRNREYESWRGDFLKGIKTQWKNGYPEENRGESNGGPQPSFACGLEGCTETFSNFQDLGRHQKTHRPYKCPMPGCSATYIRSSDLTKHKRTHYADPGHLTKPIMTQPVQPTPDKPLRCNVEGCNASYIRTSDLTKHLRIHAEQKAFACSFQGCKLAFNTSAELNKHVKCHQPQRRL